MGSDCGLSVFHEDHLLHLREMVQPVGNEKDDLILCIVLQIGKYRIFCFPVKGRKRIVQDHQRTRMGQRPCQRQPLGLAAGQTGTAAADDCFCLLFHG